ncbi:hypothetical protein ACH9DO_16460 [Kocuria sp. M1N1S27]|uniref:hypothetical protein n=1 Tax=Kocuria kalidii TaxID=3376283 RepID=UPI0037B0992F
MKKTAAVLVLPFAALTFVGCGTSGPEEGTTVEDVAEGEGGEVAEEPAAEEPAGEGEMAYDGVYDSAFYDDSESLVGEEVTVSAEVGSIVEPASSFTIAGTDDTTVEPLLIVHDQGEMPELEEGLTVGVTGTVQDAFEIVTVEEELGVDLDDTLYADWEGERYIQANQVDLSVDADADGASDDVADAG